MSVKLRLPHMSLAQCPGFLFAHREECTVEIKKSLIPVIPKVAQ
ncbi:putative phage tail fiber domain protein [Shigella flexneri K-404]|nr:hypothetical protein SF434370_2706 [Shigella flexneri 4343-70]EIQ31646.1 putative phage tail fiber domain protein [Shigella flexneri K-404]EJL17221.1 putative transposase [Shigella flexneri 6603-63]